MEEQTEFEEFHWKGQKFYRCNQHWEGGNAPCAYASYDLEEVRRHAMEPHSRSGKRSAPVQRRPSSLLGPNGDPIIYGDDSEEFRDVAFRPEE